MLVLGNLIDDYARDGSDIPYPLILSTSMLSSYLVLPLELLFLHLLVNASRVDNLFELPAIYASYLILDVTPSVPAVFIGHLVLYHGEKGRSISLFLAILENLYILDAVFSSLIHSFNWNPTTFLHAYTCRPFSYATRQAVGAVLQDIADSGVLFATLMCKHKVIISLVGAQKASIHPDDMLLLANFFMSSESFRM
ncbi:vacuolar fusion protein MON1 protein [Trifolium repens]|nr:vacuolar fusion protein MON1 protein [Trifolium repens]